MSKDLNGDVTCDICNKPIEGYIYSTCQGCGADVHNKCYEKIKGEWYCPKCKTKVV